MYAFLLTLIVCVVPVLVPCLSCLDRRPPTCACLPLRCRAGMEGAATPAGGAVLEGAQRGAGNFHAAMGKVACAVAVLVLTRRMALARMVV